MLLVLTAAGLGCGARSGPAGPDDGFGGYGPIPTGQGAGSGIPADGSCVVCDGTIECGHCLIQAYEWTYRCLPTMPPPDPSCMDLREEHVDQYGRPYTCYYCSP